MAHTYSKRGASTSAVGGKTNGGDSATSKEEDYSPNHVVYKKMENLIARMQAEHTGVQVRTVKSFISKIPSVFTGADLVAWIVKNLDTDDTAEALHLSHLLAAHGYIFPIDDHVLTVKNDSTFYRFQTPCFWPSMCVEPENTDYAVYLCKRTMQNKQRLELADYEAENLARLQKTFARKWEFVFMQAEAQAKVDRKRDKLDRQILDSQERAFWDVHRPAPGCVNTTEADIKKTCRSTKQTAASNKPNYSVFGGCIVPCVVDSDHNSSVSTLRTEISQLTKLLDRRRIKVSKVAESCISYFEQYCEYDPFITPPECFSPWISDTTEFWEQEATLKDIPQRRVRRWSFSIQELIKDAAGREHFLHFLEKEFSAENLKFWEACQHLKQVPQKDVDETVQRIYSEYLSPGATDPVNVDSRVADIVRRSIDHQMDRYCLDEAEDHIFKLMKNDSYSRYIRSDMYKEFLQGSKKKSKKRFTSEVRRLKDFTGTKTPAAAQNSNEA